MRTITSAAKSEGHKIVAMEVQSSGVPGYVLAKVTFKCGTVVYDEMSRDEADRHLTMVGL